ncbi:hypothetical protein TRICI_002983 [Trichomonascus ciferrii]|uniref:Nuclear movement protein nudC n=1 Tax=Trichomonascus ciferrii TaxID=44093 RepID=A0A642VB87_9ASCO|nr:hypothetical protein TRICI_002983 [Trichomonascus ciferrii]
MATGWNYEDNDLPYIWKQTLQEITLSIKLPENTRGKFVNVEISRNHITANLKTTPDKKLVDGPLFNNVSTDESTWTVIDQNELSITLEKINKTEWWPHVITTHPKIDVSKVQPENSQLGDLDSETRAMVEKMMFDQRQKQQGLPSSDELKKQQMFEKFKKQHPEMDFSQVEGQFNRS